MDSNYLTNPLVFLVEVIFGLYTLIVLLRFLLQWVKADFFNPMSQFIVKATSPLLNPLRRVIPGFAGIDLSSLVLAWVVATTQLLLIFSISGKGLLFVAAMLLAIPELLELGINIFLFGIFIQIIISWVSPGTYNPIVGVIQQLTDPLLKPARRVLPAMGGLDLSPMLVMIALTLLKMLLLPPLEALALQLI